MLIQPQYVWQNMSYIWHCIHSLWYHTVLWHHTYCIHVITPRIPVITSTVAGPVLLVYWLYHTYYMCDMKPTIYDITGILYDITLTLYDITILYSWCNTQSIHNSTPTLYDITYSILETSQPLYLGQRHLLCLWHHIQYIWYLTWCINDNTTTVSDITLTVSV